MNKYIKLDDAIHNINLEVIGRKEYTGDMKANLFFALDDLPTIEVSEDAVRCYEFLKERIGSIITDNAKEFEKWFERMVWHVQKCNEYDTEMRNVSEDCISREHLLSKVYDMDNDNLVVDLKDIEDAPSVVPSRAEGEWELASDNDGEYGICSICGNDADFTHYGKSYHYCPNCGAKMKGVDDD